MKKETYLIIHKSGPINYRFWPVLVLSCTNDLSYSEQVLLAIYNLVSHVYKLCFFKLPFKMKYLY